MSNTITIELCAEDRARLDDLVGAISWLISEIKSQNAPTVMAQPQTPTAPTESEKNEDVKSDHPVDAVIPHAEPAPEVKQEEPKPTITHEMIQQRVKALIARGTPEQNAGARKAVTSRARNITNLPADCLEAVWADLVALGEV